MSLPERHKKLLTPKGFDELFEDEISKSDTHEKAFKELKRESLVVFEQCIFKNYESYRISRSRRIKECQSAN